MTPTMTLLYGGPAHGEVVETFDPGRIHWTDKYGWDHLYLPEVYTDAAGTPYRVARWSPRFCSDELSRLIDALKLPPDPTQV